MTAQEADRLDRIEAQLAEVLAKLEKFEQAAAGFITGPGIAKMFSALRGAGKD